MNVPTLIGTEDFITRLFCRIDDAMKESVAHPLALWHPSEIVTLAVLYALKGVGERAYYRWLARDWRRLFPRRPERTRLFRLFATHQDWTNRFLAQSTLLGVADTYGIELIHPVREGRSPTQIGRKGLSNRRWIVGGKLGFVLNQFGRVCAWDWATANVHDSQFRGLGAGFEERMIVLADQGFHGAQGDPTNLKVCRPRTWGCRMLVERVLSMLTVVCAFKRMRHRLWSYFRAHLAWTLAAFNLLVDWHGLCPDDQGRIHLSIAPFSL
jgi:hypothetical protein